MSLSASLRLVVLLFVAWILLGLWCAVIVVTGGIGQAKVVILDGISCRIVGVILIGDLRLEGGVAIVEVIEGKGRGMIVVTGGLWELTVTRGIVGVTLTGVLKCEMDVLPAADSVEREISEVAGGK